jgi:hypothetical protein
MNVLGERRPKIRVLITFSGGLGAQVLSASSYFLLEKYGYEVYADMSYFIDRPFDPPPGYFSWVSQWDYSLDIYGIQQDSFKVCNRESVDVIIDDNYNPKKLPLARLALLDPQIRARFKVLSADFDALLDCFSLRNKPFLVAHYRQGDFLRVSTPVPSELFTSVLERFSGVIKDCIILSDSPLPEFMTRSLQNITEMEIFAAIGGNPADAHNLIRSAKVVICSLSQFSLTAALLNDNRPIVAHAQLNATDRSYKFELLSEAQDPVSPEFIREMLQMRPPS